ncbi:hypothetical protein VMT65_22460 [Nocardia sp. CDC153]|uniref:hypothetical protein n=1 Tax=Nocardia sp. CDC153 TaxID=3112167 RepID=UPI002DBE7524|nr:hypothetical protein [Nocardia sp. CDC153]MEC3955813.1 hypothetical protein [Nocardia sp. CDC153]
MSSHGPHGGDALAGLDIEIHPVSLEGLHDPKDKQSKQPADKDDKRRGQPQPGKDEPAARRPQHAPRPHTPKSEPPRASKPKPDKPSHPPKPEHHPKGAHPTQHAPKKPVKPTHKPKRGINPKLKAGAGLAGGLGMTALASGVDWRQAARDPKAALQNLKGAAVQAGKDKLAAMTDPANLPDTLSSLKDSAANAKDKASQLKNRLKGGKVDVKGLKDEEKALKDKGAALKADLKAIKDHDTAGKKMVGRVGGVVKNLKNLTKAIRTGSIVQKVIGFASKAWSVVQNLLNTVWDASPVGWVTLAIGAAVIAITLIVTHWDEVKSAFSVVKKDVLDPVGNFFEKVFAEVIRPFTHISDGVSGAFDALCSTVQGVFKKMVHQVAVVVQGIASAIHHIPFADHLGLGDIADSMSNWATQHLADGGPVRGPGGGARLPVSASNGEYVLALSSSHHRAVLDAISSDHLNVAGRDTGMAALSRSPHIAPNRGVQRTGSRAGDVDHSTTVTLDRSADNSFARARSLHAQRALTYAGGRR